MYPNSKQAQMIQAAELYYEERLSQAEIAKKLGCSRSTASRLLAEAVETGIVEIKINRPVEKYHSLGHQIKAAFDLKDVIVVSGGESNHRAFRNVGFATAEYLSRILKDNTIIGISWGVTLSYLARELSNNHFNLKGIEVIQLMGGLGFGDPTIDGPDLAQKIARSLGGTFRYIHAPCVVESEELAKHLLKETQVRDTIIRVSHAAVMISSVGSLLDNLSSMERSGYFKKENMQEFFSLGAIGHSLARLINGQGKEIDHSFNKRVIGAPLDVLRNAKWSIGIGANPLKAPVFLAAVRGKHFNVLVIDDGTAREIIRLNAN